MIVPSIKHLLRFIEHNKLQRSDGVIVFQARLTLMKPARPGFFISEIQVLKLPEEMVLYVIDLSQVDPLISEMYRTSIHRFDFHDGNVLSVADPENECVAHFTML